MPDLDTLLATHEDTLRSLLGYWPVTVWKMEQFGPLTKYTLGEMPDGRWVMLHHLRGVDTGPPHDHPCMLESHGIAGSYWEQLYHADGRTELVLRAAGGHHTIWPETVHSVVGLPEGECWTLCFAGPVVRQWRHYSEDELRTLPEAHSKYHTAASDTRYSG